MLRSALFALLVLFTLVACRTGSTAGRPMKAEDGARSAERPNIIMILADDFGWGDASCNNPEASFATPSIDRIAREGIRFTNAYTPHAVCTPTRYSLLTGRYTWRTWLREGVLWGYGPPLIPPTRLTLASMLKSQGYATAAIGKWHLGLDWTPVEGDPGDWHWGSQVGSGGTVRRISQRIDHARPVGGGPIELGFDTCFITPVNNSVVPVFMRDDRIEGSPQRDRRGMMRDPRVKRDTVDDFFVKEAIAFIDRHRASTDEQPFFIYLALNAAHNAVLPPDRFKGKSRDGIRGDKCLWVDESVGKILKALDGRRLSDDTLVMFSANNGPISPHRYERVSEHRAAGPYRGFKTDAWEGGCRVPFVARWPRRIAAGSEEDDLFCLTDVFASVAALVDHPLPRWSGEDSINQLPAVLGENPPSPARESMITQSYTGILSVRSGPWKLILDTKGSGGHEFVTPAFESIVKGPPWEIRKSRTGQLYQLADDPFEKHDLYDQHPDEVKRLQELLQTLVSSGRSRP